MTEVKTPRTDWSPQELAAEIAQIIRHREKFWDQTVWFNADTTPAEMRAALLADNTCGSTGCVAGWATVLTSPPETKIYSGGEVKLPNGNVEEAERLGRKALDLGLRDANWLFSGLREKAEVLSALDDIAAGKEWERPADGGCTCSVCMEEDED